MGVCANPAALSGVIGSQRKSFSQSLEIIDDIPCANLIFLFFAMHGNIRLFSRSRISSTGSRGIPAFFAGNSGKLHRPAPFGRPAPDHQSNRPRLPQNLPGQPPKQGRNMAAASPSSALASSEFSATVFSPKETQKQKARTIKNGTGFPLSLAMTDIPLQIRSSEHLGAS